MLQTPLASALALALGATGFAQTTQPTALSTAPLGAQPEKIPGAIRHAGIYHVATGSWTRSGGATANFGPDVVYSNTANSGYFSAAGGAGDFAPLSTNFDSGVLPTQVNTNANANREIYNVNCISIGYCDLGAPGSAGWELRFYNEYTPCTFQPTFENELVVAGLPAGGCWTVDFDLSGGQELCISGDGGDGFQDDVDLDSFGWSYRYVGTDGTAPAGFIIAGDPLGTDPNYVLGGLPEDGTNTYFGVPSLCGPDRATGFFNQDFWWLEDPMGLNSGCYFFGTMFQNTPCGPGAPTWASWYLEMQADTGICDQFPISSPTGCASNPNSLGFNSTMAAFGSTSVAGNDVTLIASLPPNTVGFFITSPFDGFVPNPGGSSGNICLGSNVGRFQSLVKNSLAGGEIRISTQAGEWDLVSIPSASGSYAAMPNLSAYFQLWHRDASPAGPTSNFTDGVVVTWTP